MFEPKEYNGTTVFGTSQQVIDYSFNLGLPIRRNNDGVFVIMMDGTRLMALNRQQGYTMRPSFADRIKRERRQKKYQSFPRQNAKEHYQHPVELI